MSVAVGARVEARIGRIVVPAGREPGQRLSILM